jgi:hypothetical protein
MENTPHYSSFHLKVFSDDLTSIFAQRSERFMVLLHWTYRTDADSDTQKEKQKKQHFITE